MGHRKVNETLSCFLAQPYMIAAVFALACIGSYFQFWGFAVFMLVASILLAIACVWGNVALDRLSVCADGGTHFHYPGETAAISYEIRNQKKIPLLWLHFVHLEASHNCVIPVNGKIEKIPGVRGKEKIRFSSDYETKSRGRYLIDSVILRSGDGFGLAQTQGSYVVEKPSEIVVYPAYVPVTIRHFLKNLWTGTSGSRGEVEDMTVLRGVRDYEPTDSWKRIDWRMAARQEKLQTKLYDKVSPYGVLFIFDAKSYYNGEAFAAEEEQMLAFLKQQEEEQRAVVPSVRSEVELKYEEWKRRKEADYAKMELSASVIGSLMTELREKGIASGIMLPRTEAGEAVTILPESLGCVAEAMYELACFDAETAQTTFDTEPLQSSSLMQYRIYLFSETEETAWKNPVLREADASKITLVVRKPKETSDLSESEEAVSSEEAAISPDGQVYRKMYQEVFYDDGTSD